MTALKDPLLKIY